jgi:nitrogen fixation NifU-like protein
MNDMYREYILDHYRNPRNYGRLDHPDIHAQDSNPLCGDQIALDLQIADGQVSAVRFAGRGCAISQASASMLTEMIDGKPLDEVKQLRREDILDALGIEINPARQKCALLPLKVLFMGLSGGAVPEDLEEL